MGRVVQHTLRTCGRANHGLQRLKHDEAEGIDGQVCTDGGPEASAPNHQCAQHEPSNGAPNFDKMDAVQRRAYHLHRLTKKFG